MSTLIKNRPILSFYILAFALTWLGWFPQVAGSRGVQVFQNPVFQLFLILAAVGPALAAYIVVRTTDGRAQATALLTSLFQWRVAPRWYVVALFGPAVLFAGAIGLKFVLGHFPAHFKGGNVNLLPAVVSAFVIAVLANPWEEVGWRGFALPRLQARYNAFIATLVVGVLWGLWHLPLFWWPDNPMSQQPFGYFLIDTVAIAFVYTWLYNSSGGSLFAVALFHVAMNTAGAAVNATYELSHLILAAVEWTVAITLIGLYGPTRLALQE